MLHKTIAIIQEIQPILLSDKGKEYRHIVVKVPGEKPSSFDYGDDIFRVYCNSNQSKRLNNYKEGDKVDVTFNINGTSQNKEEELRYRIVAKLVFINKCKN